MAESWPKLGAEVRRALPSRIASQPGHAELRGEAQMLGDLLADVGHRRRTSGVRVDASSCSTRSRIFDASSVLSCSGCSTSPSAEMKTAALVSVSKPASSRDTSLATIRSTCLDASFWRARGRGSPVSAAKPTRTGVPLPRARLPELGENVGRAREGHRQRRVALADLARRRRPPPACSRPRRPPSPRRRFPSRAASWRAPSPRRCARAPAARRPAVAASSGRSRARRARRGATPPRQSRSPCGRWTVAQIANGIDVFVGRPGGNDDAAAEQRAPRLRSGRPAAKHPLGGLDDRVGLGEAALADPAAGEEAVAWIDEAHAARRPASPCSAGPPGARACWCSSPARGAPARASPGRATSGSRPRCRWRACRSCSPWPGPRAGARCRWPARCARCWRWRRARTGR